MTWSNSETSQKNKMSTEHWEKHHHQCDEKEKDRNSKKECKMIQVKVLQDRVETLEEKHEFIEQHGLPFICVYILCY